MQTQKATTKLLPLKVALRGTVRAEELLILAGMPKSTKGAYTTTLCLEVSLVVLEKYSLLVARGMSSSVTNPFIFKASSPSLTGVISLLV